jgi:transcriptional regulator with GAF, ATPase, and Fis domain
MKKSQINNIKDLKIRLLVAEAANRIARLLSQAEGLDTPIEKMMSEFVDLVDADEGSIQVLRPYSQTTRCTLIRKEKNEHRLLDTGLDDFLVGCVLEHHQAVLSHDLPALLGLQSVPGNYKKIGSVLAVPLLTEEKSIGVVNLIRMKNSDRFTAIDQQMVTDLARQIGPFIESAELRQKLFNEKLRLQKNLEDRYSLHGIIGASPSLKIVYDLLEQLIPTDARVIILGESGTGKELIARCIHYAGPRKDRSFVAVDCGALPPNLLESELFGYVKGAFTGAINDRQGLIEEAHGGSLFLDEFTNMSLETQAKLLRVIQEGEIRPIGANQIKKVNVRIIVAASSDLTEKVAAGKIRSDLYYRLNVVSIPLPPLRERVEDIPTLSELFVSRYAKKHGKNVKKISPETIQIFEHYTWPGNIRELENVIERAVVMMHFEETELLPKHLPPELAESESKISLSEIPAEGDLTTIIDDYERQVLETVLKRHHWNKMAAARALNTSDSVIRYKMNRLHIIPPE